MSVEHFTNNLLGYILEHAKHLKRRGRSNNDIASALEAYYKNSSSDYILDVIIELEGENTLVVMLDVLNSPMFFEQICLKDLFKCKCECHTNPSIMHIIACC